MANSIPATAPPRLKWLLLFRLLVALAVILAIGYTVAKTSQQLDESDFDFRSVKFGYWLTAIAVYVGAMTCAWMFWHRVLLALGQHASRSKTLLAFFASQLGKYVPGKAMVVVIRTDMVRSDQVRTAPAAASVFIETLTWLFVGSVIGCLLLMFLFRDQTVLLIAAAVFALLAGSLTSPPVFRRIASRMNVAQGPDANQILRGLTLPTMAFGWGAMTIGWCLNGLSLWLVLYGIGGTEITWADYPLTLACVCLATVAGFVSLLPGGLGVRELVMIPMLGVRFGSVTAVVAAIIIRLVWLSAELLTSGIIYSLCSTT